MLQIESFERSRRLEHAIRLILEHRREAPIPLFSLDGHPHLKSFAIELPDLTAYSTLTEQGA